MALTIEQEEKLVFMLDSIAEGRKELNSWEQGFFDDQVKRYEEFKSNMSLSPKQWVVVNKMYEKATGAPSL